MEVLILALVVALLCGVTDRLAWLVAMLADDADGDSHPGLVIAVAVLVTALFNGFAAAAGLWLARELTPEAATLLLALALGVAGTGVLPLKPPETGNRAALFGLLSLAFNDRVPFITLALAARSPLGWTAAVGATAGGAIVYIMAALCGESLWRSLTPWLLRLGAAAILLAIGIWIGLGALQWV